MNIETTKAFNKMVSKIQDKDFLERLKKITVTIFNADSIKEIPNVKPLKGFPDFYRIKSGDYRIGFELLKNDTILFLFVGHRKDVYNKNL